MTIGFLEIVIAGGVAGFLVASILGAVLIKLYKKSQKAKNSKEIIEQELFTDIKDAVITIAKHNGLINSEAIKKLTAVAELDKEAIRKYMLEQRASKLALTEKEKAKTEKFKIK